MRFKYLTLCLLSLSLTGCAQHVIKTNQNSQADLAQQATQGLNALFENTSYDVKGQFSIQAESFKAQQKTPSSDSAAKLDPVLKKQLDQLLKTQKVHLSQQEKDQLYAALVKSQQRHTAQYSSGDYFKASLQNLLNDLKFSYQGSVHLRDKIAALTLQMNYHKPTLKVEAQVPMVIDFNEYKFYTNYFALMPFMVNRDSQGALAYLDFSSQKQQFKKINMQQMLRYLKETNALPYVLAQPEQLSQLSVSSAERQAGLTQKIRYSSDLESLILQMALFDYVNQQHYMSQIKGLDVNSAVENADSEADVAAVEVDAQESSAEQAAYASSERVQVLLNQLIYGEEDANEATEAVEASAVADVQVASAEEADTDQEESLSVVCNNLINKKNIPIGQVTLCKDYADLDLLNRDTLPDLATQPDIAEKLLTYSNGLSELKQIFAAYQSENLLDVQQFKQLWQQHQPEIQAVLAQHPEKIGQLVMDISLDQKNRVQDMNYSMVISDQKLGKFQLLSQNQVSAYGQATPIDRQALKQAKSIEEVTEGSLFGNIVKAWVGELSSASEATTVQQLKSVDDYLAHIAKQSYQRDQSLLHAYQATFTVALAERLPAYLSYYNTQQINEISEVYAYELLDDLEEPTGAKLKRLQQLRDKHALHSYRDFEDAGMSVARIVESVTGESQTQKQWAERLKTYKTPKALFAAYYEEQYVERYEVSEDELDDLRQAAQVFAQAYVDDLNGKLSKASFAGLQSEDDYFSQSAYLLTYTHIAEYTPK